MFKTQKTKTKEDQYKKESESFLPSAYPHFHWTVSSSTNRRVDEARL